MNEKEFAELAAGHALNALSDADEQRYANALLENPQWQRMTDLDAQTAALLAEAATPASPPPRVRDALLAQIAVAEQNPASPRSDAPDAGPDAPDAEPDAAETTDQKSARRQRFGGRMLFALAASIALVVGVGIGVAVLSEQLTRPASVIALEEITSASDAQQASVELETGATATAHWSESVGEAVLVAEGLERLDEERSYELWFVRDEGPVSAGVFETEDGTATALLEGEMEAGDAIAVTVEQAGGSPTGQPTTDPVIVIPTA